MTLEASLYNFTVTIYVMRLCQ